MTGTVNLSRRKLMGVLLASGVLVATLRAFAAGSRPLVIDLSEIKPGEPHAFAVFYVLSQLVTQRESLDREIARRIYRLMLDEPWGAHHIASTYAQLQARLQTEAPLPLGEGQRWFARHLLTTWYLGVYYHERIAPQRVTLSGALMYETLGPDYPRRYEAGTGYGHWQRRPGI